ncbi:MAG: trigger factor [Sulfobacillus sp.]
MKVASQSLSDHETAIQITVEPDRMEQAMDAAYKRLVKRYKIPGFRPGRAPRSVFERHVGREALWDEAVEAVIPTAYRQALKEMGIEPYEEGRVDSLTPGDDGSLSFQAKVFRKPKVVLAPVEGLKLPLPSALEGSIEEEVDATITDLRRRSAALVPTEVAGEDSVVVVSGQISGGAGEPESFENTELALTDAIAEVRAALLGAKIGDVRQASYDTGEGKRDAVFTVSRVANPDWPELDEAFAQAQGYPSLEEMRTALTNYLTEARQRRIEEARATEVFDAILAASDVEVPGFLVDREVEHQQSHHDRQEEPLEGLQKEALESVRRTLVTEALIEQANAQVSQAELETAAQAVSQRERRKLTEDELRALARILIDRKLTAYLARLGQKAQPAES